ncbi:MAG: ABC transporter permease, partial [bacterium]
MMIVLLIALVGPLIAPHSPTAIVGPPYRGVSGSLPIGTDYLGHDVLSRVLWGGRSLLWMSFAATLLGFLLGVSAGLVAGYSRGVGDNLVMRPMDVVQSLPQLVLVLVFVALLGPKLWLITLLVALAWAPQIARMTRGLTKETIEKEYVQAAEAIGISRRDILRKEVLPNISTPLTVEFAVRLTW